MKPHASALGAISVTDQVLRGARIREVAEKVHRWAWPRATLTMHLVNTQLWGSAVCCQNRSQEDFSATSFVRAAARLISTPVPPAIETTSQASTRVSTRHAGGMRHDR